MKRIISIFLSLLTVFASTTLIAYADSPDSNIYKKTYIVSYAEYDSFIPDNEILVGKEKYILKSSQITDKNSKTFQVIKDSLKSKDYTAPVNAVNPDNPNQNGKLLNTTFSQDRKSDRIQFVTKNANYTALPINETVPKTLETDFFDEESGQTITVELKLTDTKKSNSYWMDTNGLNGHVTGYDAFYYSLNNSDIQIPKSENQPNYKGYESSILKSLGLNDTDYKIIGSAWSGNTYYNTEGILCRNCIYDAQMKVCDVTATYSKNIDLPDIVTYTATSTYEDTSKYIIEAEYEKVQSKISPTVVIVSTAVGVLILAALIAVIVLYLSKKKKAEEKN